ncbi:MAG: methylenetetrahydrofolate reductase [Candidatus Margulisiibacteriota bacterium]
MKLRTDRKITDILAEKPFTFSAEFIPPRNGESLESLFKKVDLLKQAGVDFVSVTKGAGGSLRGGTLPISFLIKEDYQIPVIAHFTCMESSFQAIENTLLDHAYLGIVNILALRGDPPTGVFSTYHASQDQHSYAHQLIHQINELAHGKYLLREGFDQNEKDLHQGQPLDFCIGAAAYPEPEDISVDVSADYFVLKVKEGATYGITQMTYSPGNYQAFVRKVSDRGYELPILPGIRLLSSLKQAEFLMKTFHTKIPQDYLQILKEERPSLNKAYIRNLILDFRSRGAQGVQFFIMNEADILAELVSETRDMIGD